MLVEGAGSPAEINLRDRDIANMGFAEAADVPVILVADIDRGGVFAHLVGTLELLSASEQARVKGFVINRFRGDIGLLEPGLDWLEQRTGKPVLGVLPYLHGLMLDAEDAIATEAISKTGTRLKAVAVAYPRCSNHNDLDPLRLHPEVDFQWVGPGQDDAALRPDRAARFQGRAGRFALAARAGTWRPPSAAICVTAAKLIGICGGFQMLGSRLHDPLGLEGPPGSVAGLGLLDCETTLAAEKQLRNVSGHLQLPGAPAMAGYEIHMGITHGAALRASSGRIRRWSRAKARSQPTTRSSAATVTDSSTIRTLSALCSPGLGMTSPLTTDFAAATRGRHRAPRRRRPKRH